MIIISYSFLTKGFLLLITMKALKHIKDYTTSLFSNTSNISTIQLMQSLILIEITDLK